MLLTDFGIFCIMITNYRNLPITFINIDIISNHDQQRNLNCVYFSPTSALCSLHCSLFNQKFVVMQLLLGWWCVILRVLLCSISTVYPKKFAHGFALLCFVVVIHWLIFPYPSGLLHWHCGNLTIAPVPAKQPWWIWINTSCEFIMNDYITTTKQSTTKPCAYFLGYTVCIVSHRFFWIFISF